jgi:hypothetical protein
VVSSPSGSVTLVQFLELVVVSKRITKATARHHGVRHVMSRVLYGT